MPPGLTVEYEPLDAAAEMMRPFFMPASHPSVVAAKRFGLRGGRARNRQGFVECAKENAREFRKERRPD